LRVKDVRHCSPWFRRTLGRFLIRHEARMYDRLKGLDFAPRCYGMLDGDALLLEEVPAPSLGQVRKPQLDAALLDRLLVCVERLHSMGIVHLDLRSRRNVLVTEENQPKLIDFANALYLGEGWLVRRFLVPVLGAIDHSAVIKYRHRDFPELLSSADRERYARFLRWRRLWLFGSKTRKAKRNGRVAAPYVIGPNR
jgi:predicted Ser/Thr protein kinase